MALPSPLSMLAQWHRYQQSTPAQRAIAQRFRPLAHGRCASAPQRDCLLSGGYPTRQRGSSEPSAATESVQVLRRLHENPIRARQLQASEKRQGTKSREGDLRRCSGYGELAGWEMVTTLDFGGSKWLSRPARGYAGVFGGRKRGSSDCLVVGLEEA